MLPSNWLHGLSRCRAASGTLDKAWFVAPGRSSVLRTTLRNGWVRAGPVGMLSDLPMSAPWNGRSNFVELMRAWVRRPASH